MDDLHSVHHSHHSQPRDPMGTVWILTVIDHQSGTILDQEVFNDVPSFGPNSLEYNPARYHISLRVANINGGDSKAMAWDGDQWQYT